MSSFRAIVVAVIDAAACVLIVYGGAEAQTCSISSPAPGPLSCSVTTTVRMTLRVPDLVGVTVTSADAAIRAPGAIVHAGFNVKTNRSYALQIASAPAAPIDPIVSTSRVRPRVTWSTAASRAPLGDTPSQIAASGEPTEDRGPVQVAFAREPEGGGSAFDPIRLLLTIVAP